MTYLQVAIIVAEEYVAVSWQVVCVAIMKDGKVEIEAKGVEAGYTAVEVDVGLVVVEVLVAGQLVGAVVAAEQVEAKIQVCK